MKKYQHGFTLIELLLGIAMSAAIFLVAGSSLAFILGTTTKNRLEESLEQTKNDIQVNLGNQVRWANKIDFVGGELFVDNDKYEVVDGVMYKNGTQLTSSSIEITDFQVHRYTSVSEVTQQTQGSGLSAEYYDDKYFSDPILSRLDSEVNFNWGLGSPDPLVSPDTFSVRWRGKIEIPESANYTFYIMTDDGGRLWIDDKLVVDSWEPGGVRSASGSITLAGGNRYSIRMDYYDELGSSEAKLYWAYKNTPKQIVPSSRLYPSISSVSLEISVSMQLRNARSVNDTLKLYLSPRGGFIGSIEDSVEPSVSFTPSSSPISVSSPTTIQTPN